MEKKYFKCEDLVKIVKMVEKVNNTYDLSYIFH